MDLIRLNGLVRQAVQLIRGVEIRQGGGTFEFSVLSVFPWFKVGVAVRRQDAAAGGTGQSKPCNRTHRAAVSALQALQGTPEHARFANGSAAKQRHAPPRKNPTVPQITELYPLSGQPSQSRRRDLRGGSVTGRVTAPSPDTLAVGLEWGEPHGGTGEDGAGGWGAGPGRSQSRFDGGQAAGTAAGRMLLPALPLCAAERMTPKLSSTKLNTTATPPRRSVFPAQPGLLSHRPDHPYRGGRGAVQVDLQKGGLGGGWHGGRFGGWIGGGRGSPTFGAASRSAWRGAL